MYFQKHNKIGLKTHKNIIFDKKMHLQSLEHNFGDAQKWPWKHQKYWTNMPIACAIDARIPNALVTLPANAQAYW